MPALRTVQFIKAWRYKPLPRVVALVALFLLQGAAWAAQEAFTPPVVTVRKLPARAGGIDSAAAQLWKMPVSIAALRDYRGYSLPSQATEVRLAYDDANLYAAFTCHEEHMDQLAGQYPKHDDKVWRDDSVTVLLDTKHDLKHYFHLCASAVGGKYESKDVVDNPDSWNGEWQARASGFPLHSNPETRSGQWRILVAVPFASMGLAAPKPGTVWGADFCRHELPHSELTAWSPVQTSFHEPDRWGEIVFGTSNSPVLSATVAEIASPGKYPIVVNVSGAKASQLTVHAPCDGREVSSRKLPAKAGSHSYDLSLDFPCQGRHLLSVAVKDASGALLLRTPPAICRIPDHLVRLDRLKSIASAQKRLPSERDALLKDIGAARDSAVAAQGDNAAWAVLGDKVDGLELRALRLRAECADTAGRGYVLGCETPLRKLLRDRPFDGPVGVPARIELARNEYESAQVVIDAYSRNLKGVQVTICDLAGPDAVIPAERVTLNRVDWVETHKPHYEVDYAGWYPDPLMDMAPFDVPRGRFQPVWITVHCPKDVPAGLYRGRITVKPANAPTASLPIEVKVWGFTLTDETHLKTAFALHEWQVGAWYGDKANEMRRACQELLLAHRISPSNIYSPTPSPNREDMASCMERGLNAFNLGSIGSYDQRRLDDLDSTLKEYEPFLKEHGWWSKGYIYGFDEVKPDHYADLKAAYGWIHERYPDVPRMCTVAPNADLKGCVDIWCPLTANFVPENAARYVKDGDQVWWYICCVPAHPYANWFTDYPAADARLLFWMNWKYHVPGFLYYAVNNWESNRKRPNRWPAGPWNAFTFDDYNGDGQLIYPGPNGPLSSIRLECIRDGIEDYEDPYLLNELTEHARGKDVAEARKLLAVDSRVVKSLTDFTTDPQVILSARHEIAAAIERFCHAELDSASRRSGS